MAASAIGSADTVVIARVDFTGTSTVQAGGPLRGDYRFTFGKNKAVVTSPNGKLFILDFDQKTFTSINPLAHTYYQQEIADVLALGNRAPEVDKLSGDMKFNPGTPEGSSAAFPYNSKLYRVTLTSTLSMKGGSPGGFGGGFSTRGGVVLSGASNVERISVIGKRQLEGSLLMGEPADGLDREQMNTAFECVLLWGAPELKHLDETIRKSDLTLYGAEFSLTKEGQNDVPLTSPPVFTVKVTTIQSGTLDTSALKVPSGFRRTPPPAGPLGG